MESEEEPNFIWPIDGDNFFLEEWMLLDPYKTVESHPALEYPTASLYKAVFTARHRHWKFDEEQKYFNHGWTEETWKRY
jgi:hypothetical protein